MFLGPALFKFNPFVLLWASWIWISMFFPFWKFHYYLKYAFCSCPFPVWDFCNGDSLFWWCLHKFCKMSSLFHSLPFLFLWLVISNDLSFVRSNLLLKLSFEFLFCHCILQLEDVFFFYVLQFFIELVFLILFRKLSFWVFL